MLRPATWVAMSLAVSGCASYESLPGPSPPAPGTVVEVRVTSLPPAGAWSNHIVDREKVESILRSAALGEAGWQAAHKRELLPLFRVELVRSDGRFAVYWLGANNYPARFPCYSICSGWWIAPSRASGELDGSRYRGMTSTLYMRFMGDLGIP